MTPAERPGAGGDPQAEQEGREGGEGGGRPTDDGVTAPAAGSAGAHKTVNVAVFQGTAVAVPESGGHPEPQAATPAARARPGALWEV